MAYTKYNYERVNWKNKSQGLLTALGEKNLNVMDEGIYNIANQLDNVYQEFAAEIGKIPTMQTTIDGVESTVGKLNTSFTEVQTTVSSLNSSVTSLNTKVKDNTTSIESMGTRVWNLRSNSICVPRLIKKGLQKGDEFNFYDFSRTVALVLKGYANFGNSTSEYFSEIIPFTEKGVFPSKIVPLLIKSGHTGINLDNIDDPSTSVTVGYRIYIRIKPSEDDGIVTVSDYSIKPNVVNSGVTKGYFDLYVLETEQ